MFQSQHRMNSNKNINFYDENTKNQYFRKCKITNASFTCIIIKYSDIDEVLERANDSESGLGGSIWSSNPEKAAELVARMECGTVWVNDHAGLNPNAPFGGIKQSGFGVEFGDWGLEEFSALQTVWLAKA